MASILPPIYYFNNINFNIQYYKKAIQTYITPSHIASFNSSTTIFSTSGQTGLGTYTVYSSGNIPLNVGTYLFIATVSLCCGGNPNQGIITDLQVGYTLGTNSNPSLNTSKMLYQLSNSIDAYGHSFNNPFSVSFPVLVSSSQSYLVPFGLMTIGTIFSSPVSLNINNYSIIRIL